MNEIHQFNFPTVVRFGAGALEEIGPYLKEKGHATALVVTDRGVSAQPFFQNILDQMKSLEIGAVVFEDLHKNPMAEDVAAATNIYNDEACDIVIGIGGGAALDVAKGVRLMCTHEGDITDYAFDNPGAPEIHASELAAFIAVPTTAGTGSEVGRSLVVSDEAKRKKVIFHPALLADRVFADPLTTISLPFEVSAATAFDALTHLIEAFLSRGYNPMCDGIAVKGIQMMFEHLETLVEDPENIEARSAVMCASLMGGVAFQKGLGVCHSMAHALSTVADIHHGLANAVCLVDAMDFNLDVSKQKLAELAIAIGLAEGEDHNETGEGFIARLAGMRKNMGLPNRLRNLGITQAQLRELIDIALEDPCHKENPRQVEKIDLERLFNELY